MGLLLAFLIVFIIVGGGFEEKPNVFLLNNGNPIIFAHKGLSNYYPENSYESFVYSEKIGFKAIEIDVNCTNEGKLILFHDNHLKRLLSINGKINEFTFEELRDKKLYFNGQPSESVILSLDQCISSLKNSQLFYLDIKHVNKSVADSLIGCFKKYDIYDAAIVADANIFFLAYLKYKEPRIKTVLERFKPGSQWKYHVIPKKFKPNYFACKISKVNADHVKFLRKHNILKRMITYGVNYENLHDVQKLEIPNIIIDYDYSFGSYENIENIILGNKSFPK